MTQARWQKLTEWPLAIAAVVFLAAYSYEVIAEPGGSVAEVIIAATWVVFVADYAVNLVLARPRWRWFYTHLLDLAIVVLPMLRPLRLLRLVTLLAILNRTAGAAFRGRVIIYAAGASTLLAYVAGLAVLDAERGGDGSIQTLGQALWWAFVTITTVGYGDYFPVTYTGQLVAVGVMIGGIALIGVVTATLASWIVERVEQKEATSEAITSAHIEALTTEIASLRQLIEGSETLPDGASWVRRLHRRERQRRSPGDNLGQSTSGQKPGSALPRRPQRGKLLGPDVWPEQPRPSDRQISSNSGLDSVCVLQ